jgi:type VI secretion system ImpA family protein
LAVYFIDLDGTLFVHGSDRLLPGAAEFLREARARGHQLVFVTRRSSEWPRGHALNDETTLETLARLGIDYDEILFGIGSPRILVNDDGAVAYPHVTNAAISPDERLRWLGGRPLRGLRLGAGPPLPSDPGAPPETARAARLDPAALLRPIAAEAPSGPDLRFEATSGVLEEVRGLRRRAAEAESEASQEAWSALLDQASAGLTSESKDLELAVLLCEALLTLDGPWGLAEGLSITRGLADAFWPTLHPGVEEDGEIVPEVRNAPLLRLSAASFDASLGAAPLARTPDGRVLCVRATEQAEFVDGLLRSDPDRARALIDDGWMSPSALESLWEALAPEERAQAVRALHAAGVEAKQLEATWRERLGDAPDFDLHLFRSNLLDIEEILRGERR